MKVYIGRPPTWWGPYQLADLLQWVGVSEDRCFKIGTRLSKTWFGPFCEWFHGRFRKQKVVVKLHNYDTWNVDSTLAPVILPLLKQLQATQHGYPFTDDEDVPDELRSAAAPALTEEEKNCGVPDQLHEKRWEWIMNEMIWAFEQLNDPDHDHQFWQGRDELADVDNLTENIRRLKCDYDGLKAHEERIRRGTTLFGKYYQALWD
jgi:hypothetical protein